MKCPNCESGNIGVIDIVHTGINDNETYRKKRCSKCGYTFYTVEYEIIRNPKFYHAWEANHRRSKKKKEAK